MPPPEGAGLASEARPALRPLSAMRSFILIALIVRQAQDGVRQAYRRVPYAGADMQKPKKNPAGNKASRV